MQTSNGLKQRYKLLLKLSGLLLSRGLLVSLGLFAGVAQADILPGGGLSCELKSQRCAAGTGGSGGKPPTERPVEDWPCL